MSKNPLNSDFTAPSGIVSAVAEKNRARRKALQAIAASEAHSSPRRNDLNPPLTFEYRPVSALKKAPRRLRKSDSVHFQDLKNSVGTFGICGALLVTKEGEIIDGHTFFETCVALGETEVPCIVVDHLSKRDIRRLRISLNRIQEKGRWDLVALEAEIKELSIDFGQDLFIPGIEPPVLDGFLVDAFEPAALEDQNLAKVAGQIVSQPGDVWKLERHIIACADARNLPFITALLEAHCSGAKVRLNFSDPPYNVKIQGHVTGGNYREFVMASGEMSGEAFFAFLVETLKVIGETTLDGGLAMLFMDWRGLGTLLKAGEAAGFNLLNIVVWAKTNAGMGSLYRSGHEFIVVFKKGTGPHVNNIALGVHGRYRTNVWTYPGASSLGSEARAGLNDHPTPKPVTLLEDAILDVTNRGDLVFDSFAGSGSTLIAAHKAGRQFCGTELDPGYVDLILDRWIKLTGLLPVLAATGESFDDVKARRALVDEPKLDLPPNHLTLPASQNLQSKDQEVMP